MWDLVYSLRNVVVLLGALLPCSKVGGLDTPLACQSMYIFKQPRIGGKVGAHQVSEDPIVLGIAWSLSVSLGLQ